jgi:pimeloyl-ACP methyl ester carboxylesterase
VERELLDERLRRGFDWTSVRVWLEMSRWAVEKSFDYEDEWAEMRHPLLVMLGDKDSLLPPTDGRRAFDLSISEDRTLREFNLYEDGMHWGHLDLVLGRHAPRYTWPCLDSWMRERDRT